MLRGRELRHQLEPRLAKMKQRVLLSHCERKPLEPEAGLEVRDFFELIPWLDQPGLLTPKR